MEFVFYFVSRITEYLIITSNFDMGNGQGILKLLSKVVRENYLGNCYISIFGKDEF